MGILYDTVIDFIEQNVDELKHDDVELNGGTKQSIELEEE